MTGTAVAATMPVMMVNSVFPEHVNSRRLLSLLVMARRYIPTTIRRIAVHAAKTVVRADTATRGHVLRQLTIRRRFAMMSKSILIAMMITAAAVGTDVTHPKYAARDPVNIRQPQS